MNLIKRWRERAKDLRAVNPKSVHLINEAARIERCADELEKAGVQGYSSRRTTDLWDFAKDRKAFERLGYPFRPALLIVEESCERSKSYNTEGFYENIHRNQETSRRWQNCAGNLITRHPNRRPYLGRSPDTLGEKSKIICLLVRT